jgi:entericidin B
LHEVPSFGSIHGARIALGHRGKTRMRLVNMIASVLLVGLAAACNTVEGAGQDIKAGGQAISNTASEVKQEMSN